jgi:hypothetical protein
VLDYEGQVIFQPPSVNLQTINSFRVIACATLKSRWVQTNDDFINRRDYTKSKNMGEI